MPPDGNQYQLMLAWCTCLGSEWIGVREETLEAVRRKEKGGRTEFLKEVPAISVGHH